MPHKKDNSLLPDEEFATPYEDTEQTGLDRMTNIEKILQALLDSDALEIPDHISPGDIDLRERTVVSSLRGISSPRVKRKPPSAPMAAPKIAPKTMLFCWLFTRFSSWQGLLLLHRLPALF